MNRDDRDRLKFMAVQIVQIAKNNGQERPEVVLAHGFLALLEENKLLAKRCKRYQDALGAYAGGMARLGIEYER